MFISIQLQKLAPVYSATLETIDYEWMNEYSNLTKSELQRGLNKTPLCDNLSHIWPHGC